MRNLKKIAAIVLAATMCLGVSATAFAAGGSQTGVEEPGVIGIGVKDKDGKEILVDLKSKEELSKAEREAIEKDLYEGSNLSHDKVAAILEENGFTGLTKDMKVHEILLVDVEPKTATSEGGYSLLFTTKEAKGIVAGDTVYVMHKKHNGEWEVIPAVVGEDGFTVTFSELSPILILKVTANGDTVVLKDNREVARYSGTTQKPVEVKQSPKTGE